eukprot:397447-Rhodomonas_salina.2
MDAFGPLLAARSANLRVDFEASRMSAVHGQHEVSAKLGGVAGCHPRANDEGGRSDLRPEFGRIHRKCQFFTNENAEH